MLQGLQTQNWQSLISDRRAKILLQMRRAQLMQKVDDDLQRHHGSRDLLLSVQTETMVLIDDIKAAVTAHEERGREIKLEAAARRRVRKKSDMEDEPLATDAKGKGKARDVIVDLDDDDDVESEDSELPRTQVGEEHRARRRALQGRLREAYVLQHKGEPNSNGLPS